MYNRLKHDEIVVVSKEVWECPACGKEYQPGPELVKAIDEQAKGGDDGAK